MQQHVPLYFVGAALGIGGRDNRSMDAPDVFQQSHAFANLENTHWHHTVYESSHDKQLQTDVITQCSTESANTVAKLIDKKQRFCVIGGDHSCAIGTWSGAAYALEKQGDLGLLWVDAHLDAHTPETSETGNIHGMPIATLLGYGKQQLTHILSSRAKIKPENLCMIGIRSYESAEKELLTNLGVKIFYSEDVHRLGLKHVMQLAHQHVTQHTINFGISIDLDGLDPNDAPGTGTPVNNGIDAEEFCALLGDIGQDPRLIGYEIAEFNPHLDKENLTEKTMAAIIQAMEKRKH